jgi:hypothetical protein
MGPAGDPGGGVAPLVTVVVATFHSPLTLARALASVRRQTCADFEVWVVGDACTDDSEAVVAACADDRFHWINLTRHAGSQAGPNDEGARRARGRYLAYLGHDDLWFPWHLATLVETAARERAAFVHGLGAILGPDERIEVAGPPPRGASYAAHFVPPTNWLIERALIADLGGWGDADALPRPVDADVIRRVAASGARIACAPRLTTLKFPSPWWRTYAPESVRPQIAMDEAMARDAEALAATILATIAADHARAVSSQRARPAGAAWREVVQALRHAAGATLRAVDDWPILAPLARWRYQRSRRRLRAARGLR